MQGSHTRTKQGIAGRTTAIISDVLTEREKILSHVTGLEEITFLCAQENGLKIGILNEMKERLLASYSDCQFQKTFYYFIEK